VRGYMASHSTKVCRGDSFNLQSLPKYSRSNNNLGGEKNRGAEEPTRIAQQ
jgi:hypothetical protein